MLKGLKWAGLVLLGLAVLAVGLWLLSRYWPVPAEERAALAAMKTDLPAGQNNAYPAMWLMAYDGIPPAQVAALANEDGQRRVQAFGTPAYDDALTPVAEGRYPRVGAATGWCRGQETDCLPSVRANADAVAAAHRGHGALHARIAGLAQADHYQSPLQADPALAVPPLTFLFDRLSWHALAQVRGDSAQALQGVCEDITTGRMLMARSDTLIMAAAGGVMAARNAQLFTAILADMPADVAVPAQCRAALAAPAVAELDQCAPMRGEFRFQQASLSGMYPPRSGLFFDAPRTDARNAWQLSRTCGAGVQAQIRQDRPVQLPPLPSHWSLPCIANAAGCVLMDISAPVYDDYPRRSQDVGAQLRLAAAMLWLHGQGRDGSSAMARLEQLPAPLRSAQRPLQPGSDGHSVQVVRYAPPRNGEAAVIRAPLPRAWQAP